MASYKSNDSLSNNERIDKLEDSMSQILNLLKNLSLHDNKQPVDVKAPSIQEEVSCINSNCNEQVQINKFVNENYREEETKPYTKLPSYIYFSGLPQSIDSYLYNLDRFFRRNEIPPDQQSEVFIDGLRGQALTFFQIIASRKINYSNSTIIDYDALTQIFKDAYLKNNTRQQEIIRLFEMKFKPGSDLSKYCLEVAEKLIEFYTEIEEADLVYAVIAKLPEYIRDKLVKKNLTDFSDFLSEVQFLSGHNLNKSNVKVVPKYVRNNNFTHKDNRFVPRNNEFSARKVRNMYPTREYRDGSSRANFVTYRDNKSIPSVASSESFKCKRRYHDRNYTTKENFKTNIRSEKSISKKPELNSQSCKNCGRSNHQTRYCKITVPKYVNAVLKNSSLPFLNVKINGQLKEALLDSGSQLNVMSLKLARELNLENEIDKTSYNNAIVASGQTLSFIGKLNIEIKLPTFSAKSTEIFVTRRLPVNLILGQSFLYKYGIILNFARNELEITKAEPEMSPINFENLNLKFDNLNEEQKKKGLKLLQEVSNVFSDKPGFTTFGYHVINTENATPIASKPYRYNAEKKEEIYKQIQEMLADNIISEAPLDSQWCSPIVLVRKKSGEYRFCVNYKNLNSVTKTVNFPLPTIVDIIANIKTTNYMSTLDCISGFWQIPISEEDKIKTTFTDGQATYMYNVLPFGLKNAPTTFQKVMHDILKPVLGKFAFVYLDDVIIFSNSFEEHMEHVKEVLNLILQSGLKLKLEKCKFFCKKLNFLGFNIDQEGVHTGEEKTKAILEYPRPKNLKQLSTFLGLCSWYSQFIKNFAAIVEPLYELRRKKVRWHWKAEQENAFNKVKEILTTPPILKIAKRGVPFSIYTDACKVGIGAVLQQENQPIAYASRTLQSAERNYSAIELELLAILWALQKFSLYTDENVITIYTDHHPLTNMNNLQNVSKRMTRLLLKLSEFNYEIKYRPGKENNLPDALSRFPIVQESKETVDLNEDKILLLIDAPALDEIITEQRKDKYLSEVYNFLENGTRLNNKTERRAKIFKLLDGAIYLSKPCSRTGVYRVAIPESLKSKFLELSHALPSSGHFGVKKTYERLSRNCFWTTMRKDVSQYVQSCLSCQRVKATNQAPAGHMQSINVTNLNVWETISLDLMGPYVRSKKGNKYLLVITDYLTKWTEIFPLKNANTDSVVKILLYDIIARYGAPKTIISDNGPQFTSDIFKQLMIVLGINHSKTAIYHPQANPTERVNRNIKQMIASFIENKHSNWDNFIPHFNFALRSSLHESTNESPAKLFLNRELYMPWERNIQASIQSKVVKEKIEAFNEVIEKARKNIIKSQDKNKRNYDKKRREVKYYVGQKVLVQENRKSDKAKGIIGKFMPRYSEPHIIVKKISGLIFEVSDLKRKTVRKVHVSLIKPYTEPKRHFENENENANKRIKPENGSNRNASPSTSNCANKYRTVYNKPLSDEKSNTKIVKTAVKRTYASSDSNLSTNTNKYFFRSKRQAVRNNNSVRQNYTAQQQRASSQQQQRASSQQQQRASSQQQQRAPSHQQQQQRVSSHQQQRQALGFRPEQQTSQYRQGGNNQMMQRWQQSGQRLERSRALNKAAAAVTRKYKKIQGCKPASQKTYTDDVKLRWMKT